jgi:hypothetical protein
MIDRNLSLKPADYNSLNITPKHNLTFFLYGNLISTPIAHSKITNPNAIAQATLECDRLQPSRGFEWKRGGGTDEGGGRSGFRGWAIWAIAYS